MSSVTALRWSCLLCVVGACRGTPQQPSSAAPSQAGSLADGSAAASELAPLRPLLPQSAALLFGSELLFRWLGSDAHVELARERGFVDVAQATHSGATQAVLQVPPGRWFWRVKEASGRSSATWAFQVMPGPPGHARSLLLPADFNGDMRADCAVQYGVVLGSATPPAADGLIALDLGALKVQELTRAADDAAYEWSTGEASGDLDGDGFGDMTAQVVRQAMNMAERIPVRLLFKGAAQIPSRWPGTERVAHHAERLGDVNEDGYADVADCPLRGQAGHCSIYLGSAHGLQQLPSFELPAYQHLLGGTDLDADDHVDLVGVTEQGEVALFRGPLTDSSPRASRTWAIPKAPVTMSRLADLDGDGSIDIWGTSLEGQSVVHLWQIPGKDLLTKSAPRLLAKVSLDTNRSFSFVPGVGRKAAGILAFSTGSVPSFAFAQAQYPFALGSRLKRVPHMADPSSESGLQSIGDFNGDGWNDLLVTRTTAAEDVTSEVVLGNGNWLEVRAPGHGFTSGGPLHFGFY